METEFSVKYLSNFYRLIYYKRPLEFWMFFISTFVLSLLPYFLVSINNYSLPDNSLRNYYGDGSILTLCSGILCSYYAILFDFKAKKIRDVDGNKSGLISLILLIIYVLIVIQFYHCQMAGERPWSFIILIIFFSFVMLIFTLLSSAYLHFSREVKPVDVQKYIEERERKILEQKAKDAGSTDDDVKL